MKSNEKGGRVPDVSLLSALDSEPPVLRAIGF